MTESSADREYRNPSEDPGLEDGEQSNAAREMDAEEGYGRVRMVYPSQGDGDLDGHTMPPGTPRPRFAADEEAEVIGTPEEDVGTWDGKQSYDDTCAIRCQEFILEQFTGQEVSEDALIQQALDNGWYQPGTGTLPQDVGNLLEVNGVSATQYENATPHDLANELAQGHKVVIGIDSGELSGPENPIMEDLATLAPVDGADHAVVVSGIDTTDPNNPQVIVSDPGTGEPAASYPLDQFMASWQDSNFFMTATDEPAPPTSPEMVNFDYEEGHIPEVAGMPYEEFVELNDNLDRFNELLEEILITIGVEVPPDDGQDADGVDQAVVDGDAALDPVVLVDQDDVAPLLPDDLLDEPVGPAPGPSDLGPPEPGGYVPGPEDDPTTETIDMDPNTPGEQLVAPALDITNPLNPMNVPGVLPGDNQPYTPGFQPDMGVDEELEEPSDLPDTIDEVTDS